MTQDTSDDDGPVTGVDAADADGNDDTDITQNASDDDVSAAGVDAVDDDTSTAVDVDANDYSAATDIT